MNYLLQSFIISLNQYRTKQKKSEREKEEENGSKNSGLNFFYFFASLRYDFSIFSF